MAYFTHTLLGTVILNMKTAEEWNENLVNTKEEGCNLIREIQNEAYNQALDDAVENALISLFDWISGGFKEFKQYSNHYSINDGTYVKIDEQSILKLKK